MPTFQEIADKVSLEINQGDTLDAIILEKVYEAHRFMERNNSFLYMNKLRTPTQSAGSTTITLTTGTKRVEMIRFDYEGEYRYIRQAHPMDPLYAESDYPERFFLVDAVTAQLWRAFDEDTQLTIIETILRQTYSPGQEDWLTQQGQDAIKHAALALMAGPARDPDLQTLYSPAASMSLATVLALDDEIRRSVEDNEMRYSG